MEDKKLIDFTPAMMAYVDALDASIADLEATE